MALSPENIKILAIDVGMGTQDILLYDGQKRPENNIKLVLPSQTQVLAKKVREGRGDLFLYGETMGGGPLAGAISRRIKRGDSVKMTPGAAMSIRDDPVEVEAMGVQITGDIPDSDCQKIETRDIDFDMIRDVLSAVGEAFDFDYIGVAVQDHGHAPEKSDRIFRFEKIKDALKIGASVRDFIYERPPAYFSRMNGALRTIQETFDGKAFVADTKIAAVAGAMYGVEDRPVLSLDIGNGHTMAAMVGEDDAVLGVFEHHTGMLTKEGLEGLVERFTKGDLTNEEVYNSGGHGCYIRDCADVKRVLVTGPNRTLMSNSRLKVEFACPLGDVMMSGPVGIVSMILEHHSNP